MNFENRSIIGEDMDKSKVPHFLLAHSVVCNDCHINEIPSVE